MPRYHFHSADCRLDPDKDGIELADETAAQLQAVSYAGEVLRHNPRNLWEHGQWSVAVTDDVGVLLFTVVTLAVVAPEGLKQLSALAYNAA